MSPEPIEARGAAPGALVLYQFAFSHFNEKVRWALDYKGLARVDRPLLPGPHARTVRKLSGGPTTTPLLCDGARAISDSAAILTHLEARAPNPALFPADARARSEAEAWVRWLDDEVGPAVRLALFHELLGDPAYAARVFTTGQGRWKGALYRRLFPRMIPMLRKKMSIDDSNAKAAREQIAAGLDKVAGATRETGYLVGDRFSVADLTAGALFFPLFFPDELEHPLPEGHSEAIAGWLTRWRGAAGEDYVRRLWKEHR